jgi:aminopeptidase N
MDKWFGLQVSCAAPDQALSIAQRLTKHPGFDVKNPNRARSVLRNFSAHQAGFHQRHGGGYSFLADQIIIIDGLNPQNAARLSTDFQTLPRWDDHRQSLMRMELGRIAQTPGLSRDTAEMITRIMG